MMEAFDQPWKARYEGAVGAYWGIYDVDREPKFAFVEPIVRIPQWQTLAGDFGRDRDDAARHCSTCNSRALGTRGRSLLAIVVYARRDRCGVDHLRLLAAVPHAARAC